MIWTSEHIEMVFRIVAALLAGIVVGYERSLHGRPAGFRTHALVCTASSLLMLVTVYEAQWVHTGAEMVRLDPTRMAQGIMTGIGFLGAGVIMKDGLSIRGLTTAASIWITAVLGILAGVGFYFPLMVAVLLTLGVLSLLRWIEARLPVQIYYAIDLSFERKEAMPEEELRALMARHGFHISKLSHRLEGQGRIRRYNLVLRTFNRQGVSRLLRHLEENPTVREFRITPSGN